MYCRKHSVVIFQSMIIEHERGEIKKLTFELASFGKSALDIMFAKSQSGVSYP